MHPENGKTYQNIEKTPYQTSGGNGIYKVTTTPLPNTYENKSIPYETGEDPYQTPGQNRVYKITTPPLLEALTTEQKKIIEQLNKAKSAEKRVILISKLLDKYGLDGFVSLAPGLGDLTTACISTTYLLIEGIRIGFSIWDCLKILGYGALDTLVGSIPLIGDIADFFFKSNKYSSEIFSKYVKKLEEEAKKRGIPQEQIDSLLKHAKKFDTAIKKPKKIKL